MSHDKKHLPVATILTKTRYVGFARARVQDDAKANVITGLGAPSSDYRLANGHRWIDARRDA